MESLSLTSSWLQLHPKAGKVAAPWKLRRYTSNGFSVMISRVFNCCINTAGPPPRPSCVTQTLYTDHTGGLSLKCWSLTYTFYNPLMSSSFAVMIKKTQIVYCGNEITCSPDVQVRWKCATFSLEASSPHGKTYCSTFLQRNCLPVLQTLFLEMMYTMNVQHI